MTGNIERHHRVRTIFESVRELPPQARAAAVAEACADDSGLRREVVELFEAEAQVGSFLENGAAAALAPAAGRLGQRVGVYEITGMLGAGGMGEVYQAHDTKLRRDVALKILPEVFLADADRLTRFRREAHILASLNHPHIAAIYGLEDADSVSALVLELVPGPTLADHLANGPLPLEHSLDIARQLVDALDAAHEHGIVHRDLKPTNIKVREDGTVKVLDFGVAKMSNAAGVMSSAPHTSSPLHSEPTGAGVVLGTAAYMSPEQAQGRTTDKRTDIWAFGCVLFEMLAGRRPFTDKGVAPVSADDFRDEPNWDLLPSTIPPSIRRLLRRCLERDRRRRLADIADARMHIEEAATWNAGSAPHEVRAHWSRWLPWALAAAALGVAAWLAMVSPAERSARETRVLRTSILLPGRLGATGPTIALSPDGRWLAFIAQAAGGPRQLWVRPVDGLTAQPMRDTVGARTPFWSPDSHWVAFVQDGKLRKIAVAGGEAVTLCDGADFGGSWSVQDVILFTSTSRSLATVSASAGTASPVTAIAPQADETYHVSPVFLPDGRHFLYVRQSIADEPQVYLRALDSGTETPVSITATTVQFANGLIWFVRGTTLMAQPFDTGRRALVGSPTAVVEQIRVPNNFLGAGFFSVSGAGLLAFQSDSSPGAELVWYDRTGRPIATLGPLADYADTVVSPDGSRVLVSLRRSGTTARDFWVFDVARGVGSRVTFDDVRVRHGAIWSPDGAHIIYTAERDGRRSQILRRRADGVGGDTVLLDDQFDKEVTSASPDGRYVLYNIRRGVTRPAWVLPIEGDGKPFPLSQPRAFFPQVSPDGQWIAYMSSESGRTEIYVTPFVGSGAKTRVSTSGGIDPVWRADGKEIVYLANNTVMSAAIRPGAHAIEVGAVRPLFSHIKIGTRKAHDIAPDGRILAVTSKSEATSAPLTLVVNWPALVKR